MGDIKCILLDIDKTLTNDNKEISNETIEYFNKIKVQYYVILVTGRTNSYAVEKSRLCNASPIVISDNGAVIYNYETDEVLYSNFFDKKIISDVWDISKKCNVECIFNTIYKRYRDNAYINEYWENNNIGIDDISEVDNDVSQIVLLSNNEIELNNCLEEVAKLGCVEVNNRGRGNDGKFFADLNLVGNSKGNAAYKLYNLLNIDKSNIICFGDSMNDVSMFEKSGVKVAMKNATEDLKSIADYITEFSNNEDGVVRFLKKFLLGKSE